MSKYKLISADSHVVEPPNLWLDRVPEKYKARAPRQIRMEQGDAWAIEGTEPFPFGLTQCGGLPPEKYKLWIRWEDVRKEGYDPAERVKSQNQSKVDVEVFYPSPRIANAIHLNAGDAGLHNACISAYNDWLSEFCSYNPDRLWGLAMVPGMGGIDVAVKEVKRAIQLPGITGVLFYRYPTEGTKLVKEDDPVFALCADAGVPIHFHVGLAGSASAVPAQAHTFVGAFTGAFRFYDPPIRMAEIIYTQLLDRFPQLQVVWGEVDVGWVGYVTEQLDGRYDRQNPAQKLSLRQQPSDYFKTNYYYTIVEDRYGVKNRDSVGADRIMWSSDFPHATCNYPDYDKAIALEFEGVSTMEKQRMLADNAADLYAA